MQVLFERNGMKLFAGYVQELEKSGRALKLTLSDYNDGTTQTVFWWDSESAKRATRLKSADIKASSFISVLAYEKEDGSFNGLDFKFINNTWSFDDAPGSFGRKVIIGRLIPASKYDNFSAFSFPEYNYEKKGTEWVEILFPNDHNGLKQRADKEIVLLNGDKSRLCVVICSKAERYISFKKGEKTKVINAEEADNEINNGYRVKKQYRALAFQIP